MIKNFIKNNYKFIIISILLFLLFYMPLPYYIMAPGGSINITDRVVMDGYNKEHNGSINMLYVSEYEATPLNFILAKFRRYDTKKNSTRQVNNESIEEINKRNKIMRDNSLSIATMVAYNAAGKDINISGQNNVVVATTIDNNLKIGDIILKVNDIECNEINEIKDIINSSNVGDNIKFNIIRDNKEIVVYSKVALDNNEKVIGVVIMTDYEYSTDPKITIRFKDSESGSSGGLMLTLTVYNAITGEDLIKGRNISGTGTINSDGTVGEIDGIKYKIMGAASDNMDIVFVPSANYKDAVATKEKYNYNLKIIKVDTFNEVLEYLKNN